MSNEHETHLEHWGPWSAEYLARDDAPATPSPSTDTLERREAMDALTSRLIEVAALVDGDDFAVIQESIVELRSRYASGVDDALNAVRSAGGYLVAGIAARKLALSLPGREVRGERARYRHKKRGTLYDVLGVAELQAEQPQVEKAALTIYCGDDGKLWARNSAEFHDGRFEQVALATTPAPREKLEADLVEAKTALRVALDHYDRNVCHHEDTHRGGFLWTICDQCGSKWADDEGGFKPFEYPAEIEAAFATLNRLSGEG